MARNDAQMLVGRKRDMFRVVRDVAVVAGGQ